MAKVVGAAFGTNHLTPTRPHASLVVEEGALGKSRDVGATLRTAEVEPVQSGLLSSLERDRTVEQVLQLGVIPNIGRRHLV